MPSSMHKSIEIEKSNERVLKTINFYNNTKFDVDGRDDKKIRCEIEIL